MSSNIIKNNKNNLLESEDNLMQKHYKLSKRLLMAHIEGMTDQEKRMALQGFKKASEELLKDK